MLINSTVYFNFNPGKIKTCISTIILSTSTFHIFNTVNKVPKVFSFTIRVLHLILNMLY